MTKAFIQIIQLNKMATQLKTSIQINATPNQVWEVFSNFENYGKWNPFIKSIKGEVKTGNKIEVHIDGMKFKPKVLSFIPQKELVWLGNLGISGLFDGQHYFRLEENAEGTLLVHGEYFKGILVPLMKKKLMTETKAGFEKMNEALKELVESKNK